MCLPTLQSLQSTSEFDFDSFFFFFSSLFSSFSVRVQFGSSWAAVELFGGDSRLLHFRSSRQSKIQGVAERVLAHRFGGESGSSSSSGCLLTSGEDEEQRPLLLSWDGVSLSVFFKRLQRTMVLSGLTIDTAELAAHAAPGQERQHKLHVRSAAGDEAVLTVPDSLLLLQWCGAISSADAQPNPKKNSDGKSDSDRVFDDLIVQEVQKPPVMAPRARSFSLGLTSSLGVTEGDGQQIPKKEDIKRQMLAAELPAGVRTASMRELLADSTMKKFLYLWSLSQYCSESVKFIAACEHVNSLPLSASADRAAALRKICDDFVAADGVNTLNISGSSRKKILQRVRAAVSDEEASGLMPKILEGITEESLRVLEYDLYPQFSLLMDEVFAERAASPPPSISVSRSSSSSSSNNARRSVSGLKLGRNSLAAATPSSSEEPLSPRAQDEGGDTVDFSKLKHVNEVYHDDEVLKELLLFCTEKDDQDAVMFITLVRQYKAAAEGVRKNMSINIQRSFFAEDAPHELRFLNAARKKQTEKDVMEKMLCPPVSLFDAQLSESFAAIDGSGVFKRFCKSKKAAKKKSTIFSALQRTSGSNGRRRATFNSSNIPRPQSQPASSAASPVVARKIVTPESILHMPAAKTVDDSDERLAY